MISIIPFKDERIIGAQLDGDISEQDIDDIWTLIDQKCSRQQKLRVYVEYINFSGIPFKALFKNLSKKFEHFSDFEKEAIVSDKNWLEKAANLSNTFLSSIEVKHFSLEERQQAMDWIQED